MNEYLSMAIKLHEHKLMLLRRESEESKAVWRSGWIQTSYVWLRASRDGFLDDRGQDLVEYALVASLISLAAIASMKTVAVLINTAFTHLGTRLSSYIPT